MLKNIYKITATALAIFCCFACKKIDKLTQFDIPYSLDISVPATTVVNLPITVSTPGIKTNSSTTFSMYNTRADLIESVKLKSLQLVVKAPTGGNLSFLKDIELYISADQLAEKKLAWKYNIDNNVGSTLSLDMSGEDLKEYIKKDEISMRVSLTTDEVITQDYSIEANSVFHVDAKILGI